MGAAGGGGAAVARRVGDSSGGGGGSDAGEGNVGSRGVGGGGAGDAASDNAEDDMRSGQLTPPPPPRPLQVTSTPPAWTSTTFVITVGKSTFAFEDVNSTENVGDAVFYWQNFSVNGEPAGYVFGQRTTMITAAATQAYTGIEGIVVDDVVTYYRFFTGEQIMMAGSLVLPANQFAPGLRLNEPQQRLILGGTGKWKGATGVGTLIRNTDGTYTHRVELLRPNPAAIVSVKYNV